MRSRVRTRVRRSVRPSRPILRAPCVSVRICCSAEAKPSGDLRGRQKSSRIPCSTKSGISADHRHHHGNRRCQSLDHRVGHSLMGRAQDARRSEGVEAAPHPDDDQGKCARSVQTELQRSRLKSIGLRGPSPTKKDVRGQDPFCMIRASASKRSSCTVSPHGSCSPRGEQ